MVVELDPVADRAACRRLIFEAVAVRRDCGAALPLRDMAQWSDGAIRLLDDGVDARLRKPTCKV